MAKSSAPAALVTVAFGMMPLAVDRAVCNTGWLRKLMRLLPVGLRSRPVPTKFSVALPPLWLSWMAVRTFVPPL